MRETLLRLKRVEGQVRALQRMLSEGRDCADVLTQLLAARSALDHVGACLVEAEVERCLQSPDAHPDRVAKLVRLWLRLGP